MKNIQVYLLIVITLFSSICNGLELVIKVEGGDQNCLYDSLGEMILMKTKVECEQPEHLKFTILEGSTVIHDSSQKGGNENLNFSVVTFQEGEYEFCFENTDHNDIFVSFTYQTGVEAKDYKDLLQKDEADKLLTRAKRLEDIVHDIGLERKLIIRHQQYNTSLSKDISFKIQGFSIVTAVILLALGIFQSYYIRQFLKQKKII